MMKRTLALRRMLMLGLPLVLAGVAWRIEQIHQARSPISVQIPSPKNLRRADGTLLRDADGVSTSNPQKLPVSQQLVSRLRDEMQKHPFAVSVHVFQSTPWPKESGLDLFDVRSLILDRKSGTLQYFHGNYGWVYSHVENSGIDLLAKSHLEEDPISLPTTLNKRLKKYGWTLTEHYLP